MTDAYGPVPNTTPSARTLLDTARRKAREGLEQAVAEGGRPDDLALILINAVRGYALAGPTERRLARIIATLLGDVGDRLVEDAAILGYGYLEVESSDRASDTAARRLDPTTVVKVDR